MGKEGRTERRQDRRSDESLPPSLPAPSAPAAHGIQPGPGLTPLAASVAWAGGRRRRGRQEGAETLEGLPPPKIFHAKITIHVHIHARASLREEAPLSRPPPPRSFSRSLSLALSLYSAANKPAVTATGPCFFTAIPRPTPSPESLRCREHRLVIASSQQPLGLAQPRFDKPETSSSSTRSRNSHVQSTQARV